MPNRIIKESLCESEKVSALSDFEFRLWIGLITQADDAGRGDARPAIIKGHVFPLRERVAIKDIDAALHALAAKGCVTLYTVGGRPYFWFPSWTEHQRIRDCRPKFPGIEERDDCPPKKQIAADCRNSPQIAADCRNSPQIAADCGEARPESESNPNTNTNPKEKDARAPAKKIFGSYDNVKLTEDEHAALQREFPEDWQQRIERLSEYIASKGDKYKSHIATIRAWAKTDAKKEGGQQVKKPGGGASAQKAAAMEKYLDW